MVSFGVAPALVMFEFSLSQMGKVGWVAAFIYTAAAALRLARFNTQVGIADKRFFQGLASPSAAAIVTGYVWVGEVYLPQHALINVIAVLLTIAAGVLMVSNIRYRNFKHVRRVPLNLALALTLMASFSAVALVTSFWFMMLSLGSVYVVLGPAEELLFFKQRRAEERAESREEAS